MKEVYILSAIRSVPYMLSTQANEWDTIHFQEIVDGPMEHITLLPSVDMAHVAVYTNNSATVALEEIFVYGKKRMILDELPRSNSFLKLNKQFV